jgi:hypothetical protein
MITIKHVPCKGWKLSASCLTFGCWGDAVNYLAALDPAGAEAMLAALKCEACGSSREVLPEPVGDTFLLSCKKCRACPATAAGAADHLVKVAKKAHVVHELSRREWIESTRREAKKFGLKSTGVLSVDEALCLPEAPKRELYPVRIVVPTGNAPTDCSVCGEPLNGEFVDGVMRHSGWGYLHPECHKTDGIGLGVGRGHFYVKQEDGSYRKAAHPVQREGT